jgi:hypothetical protein
MCVKGRRSDGNGCGRVGHKKSIFIVYSVRRLYFTLMTDVV